MAIKAKVHSDYSSNSSIVIFAATSTSPGVMTGASGNGTNNVTIYRSTGNGNVTRIEFLPSVVTGEKFPNSFALQVTYDNGGAKQDLLFGCPSQLTVSGATKYVGGAEWTVNGTLLNENNAFVSSGTQTVEIVVKPVLSDTTSDKPTITDLTFGGYWISKKGLATAVYSESNPSHTATDTTVGSWNNPAKWYYGSGVYTGYTDAQKTAINNGQLWKHYISWKRPNTNREISYYVIAIWKGYSGTGGIDSLGGVDVISGSSYLYPFSWNINKDAKIRYTVHAVYSDGPSPSFYQSSTNADLRTNNKDLINGWDIWRIGSAPGVTCHNLRFYETDDTSIGGASNRILHDSSGTEYNAPYVEDVPIWPPEEIEINRVDKSSDYRIDGWYEGTPSSGTPPYSWDRNNLVQPNSAGYLKKMPARDEAFLQVLSSLDQELTFNPNGGTAYPELGLGDVLQANGNVVRNVHVGYGYGQLCNASRLGYNFKGWWTSPTGGTQVSSATKMGNSDVTVYAHWEEHWDSTIDDLVFLHYEKPEVKIGVKRDSLENPQGVRLWVKPTLHPITDKNGKDKNFVTDITDIYYRAETPANRKNKTFKTGGTAAYDSRIYYNWETAHSVSELIRNTNGVVPAFETGVLMNKVKTDSSAKQREFDINKEYQFRGLVRDALQSYYDKTSNGYGDENHPYEYENDADYSPWGQYLNVPKDWTASSDFQTRINSKSSGISDASNNGNGATLLRYVTKLLVHNPFMDEVLKESRSLSIVNHKPVWGKQLRTEQNPPETDFWQIRDISQNNYHNEVGQDASLDIDDFISNAVDSLVEMRSREATETTGGSVNGFDRNELLNYLIPTLKRALQEDENLVYDHSQINPLLELLYEINSEHDKIKREHDEYTDEVVEYSGLVVGDDTTASKIDAQTASSRILELDGERHQTSTNWQTESDALENRVRDTDYKNVELRNFEQNQVEDVAQSTIDHIYDYDISQLDLKNSLSDLVYILSRMNPRAFGSEGAKANFNNPSLDSSNKSNYWDATNNTFKDSAFTNWIPSTQSWRTAENELSEYESAVSGDNILVGTESLDKNNSYGDNDFLNNGCRATCMGLCTSGCYNTCVGGCKTACGDSCFFGCKTGCSDSCGGGCGDACGGSCTGTCSGKCQGTCSNDCAVACSNGCLSSCTGGCGDKCQAGCGNSCIISCSTGCSGSCKNNCYNSCQDGCTKGCKTQCVSSCGSGCQSNCSGRCDKSCGGGCTNDCTGGCSTTCKNGCQGGCKKECTGGCGKGCSTGCTSDCGSTCSLECSDDCNSMCIDKCTLTCGGKCSSGCGNACSLNCKGDCKRTCLNNCNDVCKKDCKGACISTCTHNCYSDCNNECGRGCMSACRTICSNECTEVCRGSCTSACGNSCTTSCAQGCERTCANSCKEGCSSSCGGCSGCGLVCAHACNSTCQRYCETNCEYHCTGECLKGCSSGCAVECGANCTMSCSSCKTLCESECRVSCDSYCTSSCKTNCGGVCKGDCTAECSAYCQKQCKSDCKNECYTYCSGYCTNTCKDDCDHMCVTSCFDFCENQCSDSCSKGCDGGCGSQCSGKCDSSCGSSCGTTCAKNCKETCNTGCTGTCNNTCTGYCVGGCKNDCGAACTDGCKNACDKGCDNSCGRTCQSDCNNKCKDGCNDSCKSVCKGGCSAQCKNSCGTDCTANCASNCSNSCTGTCSDSCDSGCTASCGLACGTSCDSSCYGSCHTECTSSSFSASHIA